MSNGRPMNSVISWLRRLSQYFTDQPPWANPPLGSSSGPPGACITPSSVRNVVTLSLRVACPPPNTALIRSVRIGLTATTRTVTGARRLAYPDPQPCRDCALGLLNDRCGSTSTGAGARGNIAQSPTKSVAPRRHVPVLHL